ncbi:MAG: fused MFS/spermidine synthase [Enterobacterales bacterium]|nr:fused MFS/spermidine synthase [Enterobacterales bacterium]
MKVKLSLLLCCLVLTSIVSGKILHSEKSMYRNIMVTQESGQRCMVFGRLSRNPTRQSCYNIREPKQLVFSYTKYMLAGFTQLAEDPQRILIIGLGGGTIPMLLEELYPMATIDSVEIDPAVIRVAKDWFNYRESPKQRVHAVDGRVYVKRQGLRKVQYDVIILDAFNGDYIPEHMMTQEYFRELKGLLAPDGLLMANTFSSNRLYNHESATYQSIFGRFYHLHSDQSGNRVIYANLKQINRYEDEARTQRLKETLRQRGVNFRSFDRLVNQKIDWDEDARLLTDQYSPANLLNN